MDELTPGMLEWVWEGGDWSMTQAGPSEPTCRNNLAFSLPLPSPLLMDSHFYQQWDSHIKMAPTLKEQTLSAVDAQI